MPRAQCLDGDYWYANEYERAVATAVQRSLSGASHLVPYLGPEAARRAVHVFGPDDDEDRECLQILVSYGHPSYGVRRILVSVREVTGETG
jgi:hypothetical protein